MPNALDNQAIGGRHFEHSLDLLCVLGPDGRPRRVNGAWSAHLGQSAGELEGRSLSALIHPDDLPAAEAALAQLGDGEEMAGLRIRLRARDGGWRWFEWSATPDPEEDLFHAAGRDVDARVRIERALERERRQLADAQGLALVGSWDWEVDTGARSWSPQHYRNHGFEPSEIEPDPQRLLDHVHPDDRERVGVAMDGFHREPGPLSVEYRVVLPSGETRVIENRCYGVELVDGSRRAVGTTRDLTAEREAERIKDEFFGLVSHELRTPLTSILGYAELLRDFESEALSEQGRRFLGVIERNSRRELGLVGALLTLSKIEAGTFRIEPSRAEIDAIAAAAVTDALPRAVDAGVRLELEADEVPVTTADPERITQLLDNLISNAIKFTDRGGRVAVRVLDEGQAIALEVADTGIGIPAGEQARIFDRLFRAEHAEELHIPGSGLGLTIVKAIVDAHEAAISLSSQPGQGSTFRVELPVHEPDQGDARKVASPWQQAA